MKHPAVLNQWLAAAAVGWGLACGAAAQAPSAVERTAQLMQQLKAGGHVLVVLHGATELHDRHTLSDIGRLNASGIGRVLAAATVPIGHVYASPIGSSNETAERIAELTQGPRWRVRRLHELGPPPQARAEVLRSLVSGEPAQATNTLVVTHRANLRSAFGPRLAGAAPGEIAVFRPSGRQATHYELVSRVSLPDLAAYHAAVRRRSD